MVPKSGEHTYELIRKSKVMGFLSLLDLQVSDLAMAEIR